MAEVQTEMDAENAIMAAVMGDVAPPDTEDLDKVEAREVTSQPDAEEEGEEETQAAAPEEDGEEFIEVPGEEGQEPTRISLKDAIEAVQSRQQFEGEKARVLEQITGEARQHVSQSMAQTRAYMQNAGEYVQAVLQHLAPPQPPHPAMLDPNNQAYNPDAYHLQRANYEQAMGRFHQVRQQAEGLVQGARQQQEWEEANKRAQEDQILVRLWPETKDDAYNDKVWADLRQHYGFSEEEIIASLSNHKAALVARDALAFRAMKNKAPEVKQQVQKTAPKLVRSKTEAKAGSPQSRDTKGQYASGALQALRKTQSDDAAAAFFAGLSKAGKI